MSRKATVSDLRRRPMQLVREAQGSDEGITITFHGSPVAVLRGFLSSDAGKPEADLAAEVRPEGLADAGCWPPLGAECDEPDAEAVLDSASWGRWEKLSEAERAQLLRAVSERSRDAAEGTHQAGVP